ncbi:MAG: hypothetical protein QOF27_1513, partial [Gaiellaceae bacterium]|nr:hypothetical protein [Gaiellaceae bacterium]
MVEAEAALDRSNEPTLGQADEVSIDGVVPQKIFELWGCKATTDH